MSQPIPLRPAGESNALRPFATDGSSAAPLAKAARQFQTLFLMELMRPLTEALSQDSSEPGGLSSGSDVYSWFWNEALAGQLALRWPLPSLPGTEVPSASPDRQTSGTLDRQASANPIAPSVASPSAATRFDGAALPTSASGGTGPVRSESDRRTPAASESGSGEAAPVAPDVTESPSSEPAPFAPAGREGVPGHPASVPLREHQSLLERAGQLFQLPVNLLRAVVMVESGGRTQAVSSKGAVGLMQLMPATAREMGIRDATDPWQNLYAGAKYLRRQLARFGGVKEALAAYNAGPTTVETHRGVPPYRETQEYVNKVLALKARLDRDHPADA